MSLSNTSNQYVTWHLCTSENCDVHDITVSNKWKYMWWRSVRCAGSHVAENHVDPQLRRVQMKEDVVIIIIIIPICILCFEILKTLFAMLLGIAWFQLLLVLLLPHHSGFDTHNFSSCLLELRDPVSISLTIFFAHLYGLTPISFKRSFTMSLKTV